MCHIAYRKRSDDEITLEKGALVYVTEKNLDGWWLVKYKGKIGRAPATSLLKVSTLKAGKILDKDAFKVISKPRYSPMAGRLTSGSQNPSVEDISPKCSPRSQSPSADWPDSTVTRHAKSSASNSNTKALNEKVTSSLPKCSPKPVAAVKPSKHLKVSDSPSSSNETLDGNNLQFQCDDIYENVFQIPGQNAKELSQSLTDYSASESTYSKQFTMSPRKQSVKVSFDIIVHNNPIVHLYQ